MNTNQIDYFQISSYNASNPLQKNILAFLFLGPKDTNMSACYLSGKPVFDDIQQKIPFKKQKCLSRV